MKARLRQWAIQLALIIAAVVLAFVLAEGFVRLFFPEWAPRTARVTQFWSHDERYGWAHVPGMSGSFRSYGFDTTVSINAQGFRGPQRETARAPGTRRAIVLGDSFVWGFGVEFDEIFSTRLEQLIPGLEAINLGVNGYGTDQELLLYRNVGRRYDADAVIVVFATNDFLSNTRTMQFGIYGKPAFRAEGDELKLINQQVARPPWTKRALHGIASRSYVLTSLQRQLEGARARSMTRPQSGRGSFPRMPSEELSVRLLDELARETAADGRQLLVVLVDGVGPDMAEHLADRGIPSVALVHHIDPKDESLHLPRDFHWNPQGHAIVAEAVAERLSALLGPVDSAAATEEAAP